MIERLTKHWDLSRIIYFSIGITLLIHAIMDSQLLGIILGSYITLMGLFGFGCAKSKCNFDKTKK